MNTFSKTALAATLFAVLASPAMAAVVVDDDGVGFVGKGDIQLIYDWNNKALQDCVGLSGTSGCLSFRIAAKSVSESTWTCTRDNGNTQNRARTTKTTTQALVAAIARVKTQVTGFNLNGFDPDSQATTSTETDGPPVGSCPTGWTPSAVTTNSLPGNDPVLEVSNDGGNWVVLPITPII